MTDDEFNRFIERRVEQLPLPFRRRKTDRKFGNGLGGDDFPLDPIHGSLDPDREAQPVGEM